MKPLLLAATLALSACSSSGTDTDGPSGMLIFSDPVFQTFNFAPAVVFQALNDSDQRITNVRCDLLAGNGAESIDEFILNELEAGQDSEVLVRFAGTNSFSMLRYDCDYELGGAFSEISGRL